MKNKCLFFIIGNKSNEIALIDLKFGLEPN